MVTNLVPRARSVAERSLAVGMPRRWAHVVGVAGAVRGIGHLLSAADRQAVLAAAWLHDIGSARIALHTGYAPVDGAVLVSELGFPDVVISLVAHHGVAVEQARVRQLSATLAQFAVPATELSDVLTFADLTTSPDGGSVTAEERIAHLLRHHKPWERGREGLEAAAPALLAAVARIQARQREAITNTTSLAAGRAHPAQISDARRDAIFGTAS